MRTKSTNRAQAKTQLGMPPRPHKSPAQLGKITKTSKGAQQKASMWDTPAGSIIEEESKSVQLNESSARLDPTDSRKKLEMTVNNAVEHKN